MMNYLTLSSDELLEFSKQIKKDFGLMVREQPVKIKLDESKYGVGWVAWKKSYSFSRVDKDGVKEHVTTQNGNGQFLIAVTKGQHQAWKKGKFVSEPTPWTFTRLTTCIIQLSRGHNLIYPYEICKLAKLLDRIIRYAWK